MSAFGSKDTKGAYSRVEHQDEETGDDVAMVSASPLADGQAPVATENPSTASAVPMIEIVAPATLMEGFELDTEVGDRIMKVTIPPGGVEKGQKFMVPHPLGGTNERGRDKDRAPVGHWKDGLFDCFRFGICHIHCCSSWCCPALAAGQVAHRLELNWLGFPTDSQSEKAQAFKTLQLITFIYVTLHLLVGGVARLFYFVLSVFVAMNIRVYMRNKYAIPEHESCPKGAEDFCVSCCCLCCSVSQMLRHTANYETYAASCCNETGMSPSVSAVTV